MATNQWIKCPKCGYTQIGAYCSSCGTKLTEGLEVKNEKIQKGGEMIELINDPDIQKMFQSIVEHLSKTYEPGGGGDTLFIFSDPKSDPKKGNTYKAFIRGIKGMDVESHIIIRKTS